MSADLSSTSKVDALIQNKEKRAPMSRVEDGKDLTSRKSAIQAFTRQVQPNLAF